MLEIFDSVEIRWTVSKFLIDGTDSVNLFSQVKKFICPSPNKDLIRSIIFPARCSEKNDCLVYFSSFE